MLTRWFHAYRNNLDQTLGLAVAEVPGRFCHPCYQSLFNGPINHGHPARQQGKLISSPIYLHADFFT